MTAHSLPETPLAVELAARGMTARALARAAGVHENSVYSWAAGKATPTTASAARVAAALGLPVDRLFPSAARPPRPAPRRAQPRILPPVRPAEQDTEPDRATVARGLADLLTRRQLSSRALADAAQLHPATIDRWLDGSRLPSPDAAARAAEALDVPVTQLLPAARSATPLRTAAAQRGWGPRQLARASGIDQDAVNSYLAGTRTPLIPNAARLATALDQPLDELFDLAAPPHPHQNGQQLTAPAGPLTASQVLQTPATGSDRWRDEAACAAPDADPERWWPTGDDPALQARTTCAGCPVLGDCRDAYLATPTGPRTAPASGPASPAAVSAPPPAPAPHHHRANRAPPTRRPRPASRSAPHTVTPRRPWTARAARPKR